MNHILSFFSNHSFCVLRQQIYIMLLHNHEFQLLWRFKFKTNMVGLRRFELEVTYIKVYTHYITFSIFNNCVNLFIIYFRV